MLNLKKITKTYSAGEMKVSALSEVSLSFRKNEFVAILGPSGCGKTTLLNIIGGLDRYDSGEMAISGRSTKKYNDSDWDAYRNHSVGFVFQSYNLIPHQSVLANVELALTLSGVSRAERRRRAVAALEQVGLGDQLHKRPNQMSGGQMQRVAIARALVNDPEIVLADEPTGALDSETSLQVMEILRQVAKDRLVIMVTHNPELAQEYSSRIIRLLDGRVVGDTNPYLNEEKELVTGGKIKKPGMSFFTALALSLNNLLTKKGRTFMVALAGSIGIIGISLILALSTGVQNYINDVESETMASYPLTITEENMDTTGLMTALMGMRPDEDETRQTGVVTSSTIMSDLINMMLSEVSTNNLKAFMDDCLSNPEFLALTSEIRYDYGGNLKIFRADEETGILQVNPSTTMDTLTGTSAYSDMNALQSASSMSSMMAFSQGLDVFAELPESRETLENQYELLAGKMPEEYNELLLVVDAHDQLSDMVMYTLGLMDPNELPRMMKSIMMGETFEVSSASYTYDELLNLNFKLVLPGDLYAADENGVYARADADEAGMQSVMDNAENLKVVGIARGEGEMMSALAWGGVGYLPSLSRFAVEENSASPIVQAQMENPEVDVFTGLPFEAPQEEAEAAFDMSALTNDQKAFMAALSEEEQAAMIEAYALQYASAKPEPAISQSTYAQNIALLEVRDVNAPASISIYPKDFEAKDALVKRIDDYNQRMTALGEDEKVISYTDYVGMIMSSVTTIVNAITYVLIAFVAISLVVSSIMIGIITYISVLERTKEIGILRAIGASKRDISRVFNAETMIIGLFAGTLGILVSWLMTFPITWIVVDITGIPNLAATLPGPAAAVLVVISVLLTLIAGLIPSRLAARKDPVVALRSE